MKVVVVLLSHIFVVVSVLSFSQAKKLNYFNGNNFHRASSSRLSSLFIVARDSYYYLTKSMLPRIWNLMKNLFSCNDILFIFFTFSRFFLAFFPSFSSSHKLCVLMKLKEAWKCENVCCREEESNPQVNMTYCYVI